jgi:t-SNARE complex subunit (syntaxin)
LFDLYQHKSIACNTLEEKMTVGIVDNGQVDPNLLEQGFENPVNNLRVELLEEQAREVGRVANDIVIVRGLFQDMAAMVNEQGQQIDTIESHIETSLEHSSF